MILPTRRIYTKCVYSPRERNDGLRVLAVVAIPRLRCLPDGTSASPVYDEHWPLLGPPPSLLDQYQKREINWYIFDEAYRAYLNKGEALDQLYRIALTMEKRKTSVTLLSPEETNYCATRTTLLHCLDKLFPQIVMHLG